MIYPVVKDMAQAVSPRVRVPVGVSCRVLGFSRQAFYKWVKNPLSAREIEDEVLIKQILKINGDDPGLGYRFIADELARAGFRVSEGKALRLCRLAGVMAFHAKGKGVSRRPGLAVHDDLVQRRFTASGPNRVFLTDISEHPTSEGKLYLCAVKDVWSNRIVGYSMGARMTSDLAVQALRAAYRLRGDLVGCVIHSDRGSQFRAGKYVAQLARYGMCGSMGRVGAAGDNAAMESFFALLQKNVLNKKTWASRAELRTAITKWIEKSYHRTRRQRALGKLTPVEYETDRKSVV